MANDVSLPRDVIMDILSRLPIKSIIRLRCVCKSWYSLTGNPFFIGLHLRRSSGTGGGLLLNYRTLISRQEHYSLLSGETLMERTQLEYPFPESFRIVDSCNGLICLLCSRSNPFTREIYLWNPAIRKIKTLLDTQDDLDPIQDLAIGFGFIENLNEYKVVQILYHELRDSRSVSHVLDRTDVYTLSTGIWTSVCAEISAFPVHVYPKAFVHGSVHWMAMKETTSTGTCRELILSFDLSAEIFQEIELPRCEFGHSKPYFSVLACRESLGVFLHHRDRADERWEMWSMVDYGSVESWTKQFVIRRPEILFPLVYMGDHTVVLVTNSKQVVLYDPQKHTIKSQDLHGLFDVLRAVHYVESLVLLNYS